MNKVSRLGLWALPVAAAASVLLATQPRMHYIPRDEGNGGASIHGAFEYLAAIRANVATGVYDPNDKRRMDQAVNTAMAGMPKSVNLEWIEMGPDNVGGRIRAVVIDPANTQSLWAGGVSGGLYHTLDGANTWVKIGGFADNLCIASIALLSNGHIYVGTGSTFEGASASGGSGFIGDGLYRSIDGGATFQQLFGPAGNFNENDPWTTVNKLIPDPTNPNRLWVGYGGGLRIYDESDSSFTETDSDLPSSDCKALDVSSDGSTIIANFGSQAWLSQDFGANFTTLNQGTNQFPTAGISRMEVAISPDDKNYMYAMMASGGRMLGVWASTNQGNTWNQIWPAGFGTNGVPELDIFGDNAQGNYDNVIAVVPGQPDRVWLGGVTLWTTSLNAQPVQLALGFDFPGCFNCVHADIHDITFAPDGQYAYVACDGGIYVTPTQGDVFYAANRFLNITQFYSLAYSPKGKVLGGTQDNGTQYLPLVGGNTAEEAIEVNSGDGFDCEISQIDPNIMFSTVYFGAVSRSADGGTNFGGFYDARVLALGNPGAIDGTGIGDFFTNIRLHENWEDDNSQDSVTWYNSTADTVHFGQLIDYVGKMPQVRQYHTITQSSIAPGDSLRLQDRVQTLFAVGFNGAQGVWVTRDACQFVTSPEWWRVTMNSGGTVNVLEWSADGNRLFWGNRDGGVFMLEGFNNAYSLDQADVQIGTDYQLTQRTLVSGGPVVTGLCADPNDPNRLMVTFGQYGGNQKVRILSNISTLNNPTVTNVWAGVPAELQGMPVYDGIITMDDPESYVVGTEYGIMASDDNGATWTFENTGLDRVPVFQVRQQTLTWDYNPYEIDYVTNQGVIYAGTHGRGAFRTEKFLSIAPLQGGSGAQGEVSDLTIFPNPASITTTIAFTLKERKETNISIYDLNGRLVRSERPTAYGPGKQQLVLPVQDLPPGTYVVELRAGGVKRTGRFVISRGY